MTDAELLAALAHHAGGADATVGEVRRVALPGGLVSKLVERIDLTLTTASGGHRAAYVRKLCAAYEVRTLEALASVAGADAAPELVFSWISASQPEDPDASGFVSPFYPGGALHFGHPIPADVTRTLARIHAARPENPDTAWLWRFDAAHVDRLASRAKDALETARAYRDSTPDHAAWTARFARAAAAPVLRSAAEILPRALTHGDMHPANIVRRADGSPVIIDWGNACLAPPMLDLANIIEIDSDDWRLYWRAYREAGGVIDEAASRAAFWWARAAGPLMYVPWAAPYSPTHAPRLIAQLEDAVARLGAAL